MISGLNIVYLHEAAANDAMIDNECVISRSLLYANSLRLLFFLVNMIDFSFLIFTLSQKIAKMRLIQ